MFNPFRSEDPALEEAIASALQDLKSFSADEEGYEKTVKQLSALYALKPDNSWPKPDVNKLAIVITNIYIGTKIIKFEETGVITSKVMNFMSKI